jgi:large subunit ribosomal protein L13
MGSFDKVIIATQMVLEDHTTPRTVRERLESKYPERVIEKAVERMITRGPLGREQMRNLHVYADAEHPHAGQQPVAINVAALNRKNSVLVKKVA